MPIVGFPTLRYHLHFCYFPMLYIKKYELNINCQITKTWLMTQLPTPNLCQYLIMDNKQNNKDSKSAQQILKKIESETSEQKKTKAYQILLRRTKPSISAKPISSYYELAKNSYDKKKTELLRKWRAPQMQRNFWLTGFLMVSTLICWQVELKFDRIKKKASSTKTFKEAQIEKQNIEINKYLSKNQFEAVPIKAEAEIKNSYKFEQEEGVFDTRDYLLEQVAKEYRDGRQIDPQMLKELREKGFI